MSIEMTRLLLGSVILFVGTMEVAAVGLTGFGWCILGVVLVRKARRAGHVSMTESCEGKSPPLIAALEPLAVGGLERGLLGL